MLKPLCLKKSCKNKPLGGTYKFLIILNNVSHFNEFHNSRIDADDIVCPRTYFISEVYTLTSERTLKGNSDLVTLRFTT